MRFSSFLQHALFCLLPSMVFATQTPTSMLDTFFACNSSKIFIDVHQQTLYHLDAHNQIKNQFPISSGKSGTGEKASSGQTPRGLFYIGEKYGHQQHPMRSFNARVPTKLYNPKNPDRKGIISRIMTLDGSEQHNKNTKSRYVYIHGTPFTHKLAQPVSQGCIRMDPYQIIDLYNTIDCKTPVYIWDKNNIHLSEKNTAFTTIIPTHLQRT